MNNPMTRPPDRRDAPDAGDPPTVGTARSRLIVILCLAVVVAGWAVNGLLVVADDRVLGLFIDALLPVFEWLLRMPEHLIV
jgi:hypothetical protein